VDAWGVERCFFAGEQRPAGYSLDTDCHFNRKRAVVYSSFINFDWKLDFGVFGEYDRRPALQARGGRVFGMHHDVCT
jgi:hypothetical protein